MSNVLIGCAIWGYRPWVGAFLPAGTSTTAMLSAYSQRLTAVEINATFYAIPDSKTVARWATEVPDHFRFCPKIPQAISHAGKLNDQHETMQVFVEQMQPLQSKVGRVFLQLPPRYSPQSFADLEAWLERWANIMPLAVEVRHRGWFEQPVKHDFNQMLAHYDVSRVLVDVRPINTGESNDELVLEARRKKPNVPFHAELTNQACLLRFMGHPDLTIDVPLLEAWADLVATWSEQNVTVYAFMHCPAEEQSPIMCQMFAAMLEARGLPNPLTPPPVEPEQMSLFG